MTPGARLQAAIEILTCVLAHRRPADGAMADWARRHRFAGSGDRRAIEARVFFVLRRRNECAQQAGGHIEPRALVLGSLKLEGAAPEKISALFEDGAHAPGPLSAGEQALAGIAAPAGDALWTRLNYPDWLHGELSRSLGPALTSEMEAMGARAALDLRVNRLKATREAALQALSREGIEADASALTPDAVRLRTHAKLDGLTAYQNGWVEVQDAASQAVCAMLDAQPGERVADLCAGAGGKTLALAAAMENRGSILACDVDGKRLGRLAPRAVRAGATIVEMTGDPYADHPHLARESMDAVLADAPCSGSGTWRRNPEAKWTLDESRLDGYRAAQAQTLDRAADLTRPGGRILYVTCSLLRSEGEDQIEAASARHPCLRVDAVRRFSPASTDTDGFFAALLFKTERGP